jgi:hypothetical protein
MTKTLKDLPTDELVELFEKNALEQDDAIFREQISKFKKLYPQMLEVRAELSRRGSRASLTKLFDHENMQVRLQAAMATLIVAPVEARQLIEAISKTGWMPQAANAKETLRNLDSGFFKPS